MKIIVYNPNTESWHDFINSLTCKGADRENAIYKHIEEIGTEISATEYWDNRYKYRSWNSEQKVAFIGDPLTALEKIIKFVDDSSSYCHMTESFPEDFTESRTDWYAMQNYADEMSSFIKDLADDLSM